MAEEAEISRCWTFKYPPSARERQCIEIKDSNLPDWQQSVNYKGDSNQLEIVLYKTDKRQKGFFAKDFKKHWNIHKLVIVFIDTTVNPQRIRKYLVTENYHIERIKKQRQTRRRRRNYRRN